jgi:hypothetical protein
MGDASFLGNTIQAIGTIAAIACSFVALAKSRKEHASKEELIAVESRINSKCAEINHKLDQFSLERDSSTNSLRAEIRGLASSLSAALQDTARAIGRLEGSHDLAQQIANAIKN